MANITATVGELRLAAKYSAVSLIGFTVDAIVLHLALVAGLQPAWARVISLATAMNVTFAVNRRLVFQCSDRPGWARQWLSYMGANGLGNLSNYWVFVSLVSFRWPIISTPIAALAAGSVCAWVINYVTTRWLVFGSAMREVSRRVELEASRARERWPRPGRRAP